MYRAYVTPGAAPSFERVPADYVLQRGEALFDDAPSADQLAKAFPEAVLVDARESARRQVSAAAETARLQFVSPGSAKAMAYQEKAKEAEAFIADPAPSQQKYPLLYAEVGATADDVAGVAAVVIAKYRGFKLIEAQIGGAEAAAQKAIAGAADLAAIAAVVAGLAWPQPQ